MCYIGVKHVLQHGIRTRVPKLHDVYSVTYIRRQRRQKQAKKSIEHMREREREKEGEQQRCTTNRVINVKMAHTTTVNDAKKKSK